MIHVMLPVQYLRRAGDRLAEPQKRLMLAVLKTVVEDCETPAKPLDVLAHRQAWAYVRSTDRAWPFSFENVCEAIGLDAGSVRRGLALPRAEGDDRVAAMQAVLA